MEFLRNIWAQFFLRPLVADVLATHSPGREEKSSEASYAEFTKNLRKPVSTGTKEGEEDNMTKGNPIGPNETRELFRKLTRGRVAQGIKWGVFDDAEEGNRSGFIVNAVAVDEPHNIWNIEATEIKKGKLTGWSWILEFKLNGEVDSVDKMQTDQGETQHPIDWEVITPPTPYFPSTDVEKMREAMDVTHDLLTALRAKVELKEPPLSSKDKEYGLIL